VKAETVSFLLNCIMIKISFVSELVDSFVVLIIRFSGYVLIFIINASRYLE